MAFIRVDTIHLFAPTRDALVALLGDLTDAEWDRATVCPGWSVKDVALHLLGVETANLSSGRDDWRIGGPNDPEELGAWLADFNEEWVRASRRLSNRLTVELISSIGAEFERWFSAVDFDSHSAHVSWASASPVPMWLHVAREYTERWVHQQQIRDAVEHPGLTSPEFLRPVIATFVHALPMTYAQVDAPEGTEVEFRIGTDSGGTWHLRRQANTWELCGGEAAAPAAVVTTHAENAWRLFTRSPAAEPATVEGDTALGSVANRAVAIIN